jgi:methyltransferase (TIGR00027 family)
MKADRPSRTAQFVALGRAIADDGISHVPGFSDPTARRFLNDKNMRALEKTEKAFSSGKRSMRLEYSRVMADMMALRTTAIDTAVRDAIARGAKQLVILGAGFDGRAWRMKELAGVRVFEVDHPATQAAKQARVPALPPAIGQVTFVPVNFEVESLTRALDRAGQDRTVPTCWIWEGVVMYLTRDAMRATLAGIAERSASGSTLVLNYHTANRRWFARLLFRLIGEPMISAWSPAEMAEDLAAAGFQVREDSGVAEWNAKWAGGQANDRKVWYMRVVVASRR